MSANEVLVPRDSSISRRAFLKTSGAAAGVFLLGARILFPRELLAQGASQGVYDPNFFIKIAPDNSLTIISKHFEMGQGVTTGLATLIAEELDADWSTIDFEFSSDDARIYNNLFFGPIIGTGGSTSMAESWEQMRKVGAAARLMFISAAAAAWNVPASEIKVEKSVVSHSASNHRAAFGELAAAAMKQPVPKDVPLKTPAEWDLIGTRVPRLDSKRKTTGKAMFAMDVRRPEMLTVVIQRPPYFGATVASFDATEAKKIPGVVDVIRIPAGIAVYANETWAAIRGQRALNINWDTSKAETRSTSEILAEYRHLAATPGRPAGNRGDAVAAISRATKTIDAEYAFPYLAHAPMEPMNGVLEYRGDSAEIWSGSQLPTVDQFALVQGLGVKPQNVNVNVMLGGGSFGRRANPVADWTAEIAQVSKAINGRAPVHVVWTREDDIKGGYYRPMTLHRVKVGLDSSGKISGWQHAIVSKSIFIGTPMEAMAVKNGVDHSSVEGVVDTPYAIPDMAVEYHNPESPVTVLWFRSVGNTHSGFAMETMMDQLAHAAGKDPVAFRLEYLDPKSRDAAVIQLAAEKAGWSGPAPSGSGRGRGRGFAYHYSFGTRVAMVADVSVVSEKIKVDRIVAAVDCGVPIDPDVVVAQIQGAIGFALSTVFRNQVTLNKGLVEQSNFDDYEPTRMREMPAVEVYLVPSTEHPSGIGEPGVPPLAPAVGNALFAATGVRRTSLPFRLATPF